MKPVQNNPNEKYNYGYVKYGFDVEHAQMDEATVYYIKLFSPAAPGFISAAELLSKEIDAEPIVYDNVELTRQFNGETLFSAALKNGYFNQAVGILKYLEPFMKATIKDPDNTYHRAFLFDVLKLDDPDVVQALENLAPFHHKGAFEQNLTGSYFQEARKKAELIRTVSALMPLDFPYDENASTNLSWFSEFIKNKQFNLAEQYLAPYRRQYPDTDILVRDLSLDDAYVSHALKEMSSKAPLSVFGRIHTVLKEILPTDLYLSRVLHKERYDLAQEMDRSARITTPTGSRVLDKRALTPKLTVSLYGSQQTGDPSGAQGNNDTESGQDMALFKWSQRQGRGE